MLINIKNNMWECVDHPYAFILHPYVVIPLADAFYLTPYHILGIVPIPNTYPQLVKVKALSKSMEKKDLRKWRKFYAHHSFNNIIYKPLKSDEYLYDYIYKIFI